MRCMICLLALDDPVSRHLGHGWSGSGRRVDGSGRQCWGPLKSGIVSVRGER